MANSQKQHLTDEEIVKIKKIIKEDERMMWLWSILRKWAVGIAGTIIGIIAFWDSIKKGIQLLIGN